MSPSSLIDSEKLHADDSEFFAAAMNRVKDGVQNITVAAKNQFNVTELSQLSEIPPELSAKTPQAISEARRMEILRQQVEQAAEAADV